MRKESDFAEIMVDRLFLESFANEESPYFVGENEMAGIRALDKFRNRLKWHVNNSLSRRQREVVRFYLSGKTEREIGTILGITQQVVNIYKHRAIKKLHKILTS